MLRHGILLALCLYMTNLAMVNTAKQQLKLSDSYLPVVMQVIAHLTDQMAYESKDEPTKTTTLKPTKTSTSKRTTTTTATPMDTTPVHGPGLFAPSSPPIPADKSKNKNFVLLPTENETQYTVLKPEDQEIVDVLLSAQDEEINPLIDPLPESAHFLPPNFDSDKILTRSGSIDIDNEYNDDNLQYLSENVKNLMQMAHNPYDDRLLDIWEGVRAGASVSKNKANLSSSNLRLLLLYDLLSREAKRLKLSDYTGYSDEVMNKLADSAGGGARSQLSFALSQMLDHHDCQHEYANNRAREIVTELSKDSSTMSSELRYLEPLVYKP